MARVKMWLRISVWLMLVFGAVWPTLGMMLDYLTDMEGGNFGKTVPTAVACSISYIEKMAGFSSAQQISTQILWKQSIASLTLRGQSESQGSSVKKAPQYFIVMLIALELYVCSTRSNFKRAFAWIKLIKHWCGLRHDDLQALDSARLTLGPFCLRGS